MAKPFVDALRKARALVSTAHATEPVEVAVARKLTQSIDDAIAWFEGDLGNGDLVSAVCHDMKDPLASVVMGAGFLQRALAPEDESVRRAIKAITRSADRLGKVISDFHDLAKLEVGRLPIDPRACDVSVALAEAVEGLESRASERGVKLTLQTPDGPTMGLCDPVRLVQIVCNLVANAIRFTGAGGTVAVRAECGQAGIRILVTDTGRGIPPERLPTIFDHRANSGRMSRDGPGLGLAIVKALVEQQGGQVKATSTVGKGSLFEVTLPKAQ
ncbi:MAG: sensor histidine kinase [Polyangiaceae bacterium]|jgi:signal transduction histidine kinase